MASEPHHGELVEPHGGLGALLPVDPFGNVPGLFMSWDMHAPGGIDRMSRALRPADKTSDDILDDVFPVEHILCHTVELTAQETGECVNAIRCVLIGPDGTTVAFVSVGVMKSLPMIARVYGMPPWPGGKPIRCFRQKTRRKFHVLLLEPVEESKHGEEKDE